MSTKLHSAVQSLFDEMKRQNMSIRALADKADVSHVNLYAIFSGDVSPTTDTLDKLARVLKMKVTAV